MANKYTAGAYMSMEPIKFNSDILDEYDPILKANAAKIADRRQKNAETKAAQDKFNKLGEDMAKYTAEALNITPTKLDDVSLDDYISQTRKELIMCMRLITNPATSAADRIMLQGRVQQLSDRAKNYVKDRESFFKFSDEVKNADTEDGMDSTLSGDVIRDYMGAITSANKDGSKRNEDGSVSVGKYMTQRFTPNGYEFVLRSEDGEREYRGGTWEELTRQLQANTKRNVDLNKEFWNMSSDIKPLIRYERIPNEDGTLTLTPYILESELKEVSKNEFRARFPNAKSIKDMNLPLQKALMELGEAGVRNIDDLEEMWTKMQISKVNKGTVKVIKNPAYLDEYKKWQMSQKSNDDLYNAFLDRSQAVLSGDTDAISSFGSDKLISLPGGRVAAVSIAGRKGDDFIFKAIESVVGKDGKTSARNAEDIVYDMRTESGRKAAMGILTQMYNSSHEGKEGSLLETEVDKRVDYTQSPYEKHIEAISDDEIKNDINSAISRFENGINDSDKKLNTDTLKEEIKPFVEVFEKYGYEPKETRGNYWLKLANKNMQLTLKDKSGKRADIKIEGNTVDEFIENIRKQLDGIVGKLKKGYEEKEVGYKNPNWLKGGSLAGGSSAGSVSMTTRRSGTIPNLNNF